MPEHDGEGPMVNLGSNNLVLKNRHKKDFIPFIKFLHQNLKQRLFVYECCGIKKINEKSFFCWFKIKIDFYFLFKLEFTMDADD